MKVGCLPDAIAPIVDPAVRVSGAGDATDSGAPVPMGPSISVVVVGLVVGAGAAQLTHDAAPAFAWLMAFGLCGGLFAVARRLARSAPTHPRLLALIALACLTFSYLLVLGGESTPRPTGRSAIDFVTVVVMLLAILAAAATLPTVILVAALRSGRTREPHQLRLDLTPQLLTTATGAAMFLVGFLLFATALWASSPEWRVRAIVSVGFGGPIVLLPFGTYMYQRLLSRWRVAQSPCALLEQLETLRDLTGFEFDEVLCLQARFGSGRVCQVVTLPGRSTLVFSESIADDLSSPQLLAVLAHEAAHVCLNHFRRKITWGVVAGVAALTAAVVLQVLVVPLLPRALQLAGVLGVVLPILILRGLHDTFVIRRHEAEADKFAVDTAGGQALIDALGVLGASGEPVVPNRWTTHSAWGRRVARIREWETSRRAG